MNIHKIIEKEIIPYLPVNIRRVIVCMPSPNMQGIEEIRLRADKPLMICENLNDWFVNERGKYLKTPEGSFHTSQEDVAKSLELMCDNSIYSVQEDIKQGYITLRGGHRVGITGKVLFDENGIRNIKYFSGLNIRISRQVIGAAEKIIKYIVDESRVMNTLIISPPQCGKTTLIRDLTRMLSNGIAQPLFKGVKVGIVDERSEIASCYKGVPQNDVGIRTDVLDSCPKSAGMITMLRAMSPVVIVTDELGGGNDKKAVLQAINAGVKIITTAHGASVDEVRERPETGELIDRKVFERFIILSNLKGAGTVEEIIEGKNLRTIYRRE